MDSRAYRGSVLRVALRGQLLFYFQIVTDRQDSVAQIAELPALALVGFFPVGLVVIGTIAEYADKHSTGMVIAWRNPRPV